MKIQIQLFGIAKDIIGSRTHSCDLPDGANVEDLIQSIQRDYPKLTGLQSLMVAVNDEYAEGNWKITEKDEIALIPPVSGG